MVSPILSPLVSLDEIDQRIDNLDKPRSDRRKDAARTVGTLAAQRAAIVAQLAEIDRELGEVLAAAEPDIGVDELAAITDLNPSDLTDWLAAGRAAGRTAGRAAGRKPGRGGSARRQKTTVSDGRADPRGASADTKPPTVDDALGSAPAAVATEIANPAGPDAPGPDAPGPDTTGPDAAGSDAPGREPGSGPSASTEDRVARVG